MKRVLFSAVLVASLLAVSNAAISSPSFSVSADQTIQYNPNNDSFAVTGITLNNPPSYIQVGLALTDLQGNLVESGDDYRIGVGLVCQFENSITGGAGGTVSVSGDNSTVVLLNGASSDVADALTDVWIYKASTLSCSGGNASKLSQPLLLRKLQISAIETAPGLKWSPQTQHYYELATQTSSDGMGQPTDDSGNITDSSRYFVKWSTARANAKASTITINGNTHQGYLASIITKDEFNFLNNNVSGGSGTLYPAWVGGSDGLEEGKWRWVDGPEAANFGGDTLTREADFSTYVDPYGTYYYIDNQGNYYSLDAYEYPRPLFNVENRLLARDSSGDIIYDSNNKPLIVDTSFCSSPWASQVTSDGATVFCNYWNPVLIDSSGIWYYSEQGTYSIPYDIYGNFVVDQNDGYVHQLTLGDLTYISGSVETVTNYNGALFWGPDGGPWSNSGYGICGMRGARGICNQSQQDSNGEYQYLDYYVYWSNGDQAHQNYWDLYNNTSGDGLYSPQPDNAALNGIPDENALIINWCARNNASYAATTDAINETLYGNSDYYCTPGWNDLAAGDWGGASATYPNTYSYDTPNQIGTTDYIIEYCGYSTEAACSTDPAAVIYVNFGIDQTPYASSDNTVRMSFFNAPGIQNTILQSDTMVVETFNDRNEGYFVGNTAIGNFAGTTYAAPYNVYGGAGGTGKYAAASDAIITLPTTERYIGFWWSAGNSDNNVQLMDSDQNVLATITTADILQQLGPCDGTNPFCGNPNGSGNEAEPYVYINIRYPAGFSKVRLYGTGFELDNIAISVSVPPRSVLETSVTASDINLDCTNATQASASATLTACPQEVSIDEGSTLLYDPLADSQIVGYSYPGSVSVIDAYIYSGDGSVSFSGSNLSITSNTVGVFYIDYTIDNGSSSAASRITVDVNPVMPPPPPSAPVISWSGPGVDPTVIYQDFYSPVWSVLDSGSGISSYGTVVRQVATYAGDTNCMSDWTTDESEVVNSSIETVSYGHCYRYSFDVGLGGMPPQDNSFNLTVSDLTSSTLIVVFETTILAPTTIRVDPRNNSVRSPQLLVSGGDVQACLLVTDADGNWDSSSNLLIDVSDNGYADEFFSSATLGYDNANYIRINGPAADVTSALSSIAFKLGTGKYSQSYRIHIDVGPILGGYPDFLGCSAAKTQGRADITIEPYGLRLIKNQPLSLTARN